MDLPIFWIDSLKRLIMQPIEIVDNSLVEISRADDEMKQRRRQGFEYDGVRKFVDNVFPLPQR